MRTAKLFHRIPLPAASRHVLCSACKHQFTRSEGISEQCQEWGMDLALPRLSQTHSTLPRKAFGRIFKLYSIQKDMVLGELGWI